MPSTESPEEVAGNHEMFTGWLKPFGTQRPLMQQERRASLTRVSAHGTVPDEQLSLLALNDLYAEFVDRAFRLRGSVVTLLTLVCIGIIAGVLVFVAGNSFSLLTEGRYSTDTFLMGDLPVILISVLALTAMWRRGLGRDMFTYVYYPVRFDRVTQHVHVFRHNGKGGVLSVPFDQVFWFVGRGDRMDVLCDLRGAVLDGENIVHMFAVGHYFGEDGAERVKSLWSFICAYMAGGPSLLAARGVKAHIDLSVEPAWRNCWRWVMLTMGAPFAQLRYVLAPIYYPVLTGMAAWRWLVLNSCRKPEWPPELFSGNSSAAEPGAWQEPALIGEFEMDPVTQHATSGRKK